MTVALLEAKDLLARVRAADLPCLQAGPRSKIHPKRRPVDAIEKCLPTTYWI